MSGSPSRRTATIAFIVTLVGAVTIMISPIASWTAALAFGGLALVVPGMAVLIWWLLGNS